MTPIFQRETPSLSTGLSEQKQQVCPQPECPSLPLTWMLYCCLLCL